MNSMITTISSKNITAVIAAIILCLSIVLTACAPTELPNDSELPSVSDAQGTLQPTSTPDDRLSFKYSTEPLRDSVSGSAEEASNQPADAQPTTEPGKNSSALRVYLTFDDGPCKKTKRILSILDEYGIKASFFTVGYFIDRHPDIVVEMINSGHLVCCHTYSHEMRDIYASPASFMRDIERWTEAYTRATGTEPPYKILRFPGGSNNCYASQSFRSSIKKELDRAGWRYFDWSFGDNDRWPAGNTQHLPEKEYLISSFRSSLRMAINAGKPLIFLAHDTFDGSVELLPEMIEEMIELGCSFGTIDELEGSYGF